MGLLFESSFLLVVGFVVFFDDVPPSYPPLTQASLGAFGRSATLLSPPMLQMAGSTVCSKRKDFNRPRSISLFSLPLRDCLVQTRMRLLIVSTAKSWVYPSFSPFFHGQIGWHPTTPILPLLALYCPFLNAVFPHDSTPWFCSVMALQCLQGCCQRLRLM